MNKTKNYLTILVFVAFIMGCIFVSGTAFARKPIGSVSIFEINDLTGPTSDSCVPHHNGIWDVFRSINEEGGILYNDPKTGKAERVIINFSWGDNKAQAGPVPTLYERLSNANPKPVMCYMGSSAAAETIPPWTARDNIVQISGPSGQPTWSPPQWSFTVTPDYPADACTAAWWAMEDWKSKGNTGAPGWAWFTLNLPFGKSPIRPESEAYIKNLGFNIVGTWTMPFVPVDVGSQFRSMINAGANYTYGNLVVLQQQKLVKDIKKHKLEDKLKIIACPYGITDDVIKVAGESAEGLVGVHYSAFPDELDKPAVKEAYELSKKYKHKWNSDAILGVAIGKIMISRIKAALEKKGYPITGKDVYAEMLDPAGIDSGGLLPLLKFNEENRRGIWVTHMRAVKDGKIVRASRDFDIPDVKPNGPWSPK